LSQLVKSKLGSLILPMLLWNAVFCVLVLTRAALLGRHGAAYNRLTTDWLGGVTGISGPTANLSLFFLRDLFASTILLGIILPLVRRLPLVVLALVFVLTLFELTAPVVFRPSILLFLLAGFIFAQRGGRLLNWARPEYVLGAALAFGAFLVIVSMGGGAGTGWSAQFVDLVKRGLLTVFFIGVSGLLATTVLGGRLAPLGRHMFPTYLSHQIVFSLTWFAWTHLVGGPSDPLYLVFFLAMPAVAIAVGTGLGLSMDSAPAAVQQMVRGKVRRRAPAQQLAPAQ
jgi:fucose 4-O-acetylase-like acetyltransferase